MDTFSRIEEGRVDGLDCGGGAGALTPAALVLPPAGRGEGLGVPPWMLGVRWVCVLGFLLAATFPGLQGFLNAFGGLCAVLFLHHVLLVRTPLLPSRRVRIALFVFLGMALVFVLYPPLVRGAYPLKVTAGTFWHTLRGVAAAGILLSVVRTPCALGYGLLLYPFFLLVTVVWVHASGILWTLRDYEALGNSNILGMRIQLAAVAGLAVLLLPALRRVRLRRWMVYSGYTFAAISPMLLLAAFPFGVLLRGQPHSDMGGAGWYVVPMGLGLLASIRRFRFPEARGTWVFYVVALFAPMLLYAGSILTKDLFLMHQMAVLLMCAGTGAWWLLSRAGWLRGACLVAFLVYAYVFLFDLESRQSVAMVTVAFFLILAGWRWGLRRGVLPLVVAGLVVVGVWAGLGFPGVPEEAYWRQDSRQIVWMHSLRLGREYPWIGHGYGFRAFQAAWEGTEPLMPPWLEGKAAPELLQFRPMHAHNILVQFFVERGVLGLLLVFGLWVVVLHVLAGHAHSRAKQPGDDGGGHARIAFVFFLLLPLQQMVDYTLQGTAESFFWLFFALLMAYGVYRDSGQDGGESSGEGVGIQPHAGILVPAPPLPSSGAESD